MEFVWWVASMETMLKVLFSQYKFGFQSFSFSIDLIAISPFASNSA